MSWATQTGPLRADPHSQQSLVFATSCSEVSQEISLGLASQGSLQIRIWKWRLVGFVPAVSHLSSWPKFPSWSTEPIWPFYNTVKLILTPRMD